MGYVNRRRNAGSAAGESRHAFAPLLESENGRGVESLRRSGDAARVGCPYDPERHAVAFGQQLCLGPEDPKEAPADVAEPDEEDAAGSRLGGDCSH